MLVFVSFFLDSKQTFFFSFALQSNYKENNLHEESEDMEFFYQSSTRHLSSERSDFPYLASHVDMYNSKNG